MTPSECEIQRFAGDAKIGGFSIIEHDRDLHRELAEKDARIRELVEKVRLATYCDFHEADGTLDCEECEEARAALARSEGGGA